MMVLQKTTLQCAMKLFEDLKKVIDYEKCPVECGKDKGDGRYRGRGPKKLYGKAEVSITAQNRVSVRSKLRHIYINKIHKTILKLRCRHQKCV